MNGMTSNKIFASILLAGLIAMFSGFIAELVFHIEEPEETAFSVDTSGVEGPATAQAEQVDTIEAVGPLLANASVEDGLKLTRACTTCHSFEKGGAHRTGPNLWGIVNAARGKKTGFAYSEAMASLDAEWTYERLNQYLYKPKTYVPGTKMNYTGMRDLEDRANLIAWMREQTDAPAPLPPTEGYDIPDDVAAATDADPIRINEPWQNQGEEGDASESSETASEDEKPSEPETTSAPSGGSSDGSSDDLDESAQ